MAALAAAAAAPAPADWPPRGFEAGEGGAADWAGMGERFVENSPCMLFGHPTIPVSATERETQSVWVQIFKQSFFVLSLPGDFFKVFLLFLSFAKKLTFCDVLIFFAKKC